MARLTITVRILADGRNVTATGREAETLIALVNAGQHGITSLETFRAGWAARLAAYVHDLRKLGVPIESMREPDDGGNHARYRLAGCVEVISPFDQPEGAAA